ncbi:DUF1015 domain-containing protein [Blastococcus sp. SYSU DS0617]
MRPFRALTYASPDPAYLARVSSPAYDLVTTEGRERLAGSDPHNIVRLILPQADAPGAGALPAAVGAPPSWATQAARTLRAWEDDGVLVRDETPAVWAYELQPPGEPATAGWLAAVGIPAPGSSAVLPHEDTFPVAVEGRRSLLAATRTDLEPIVLAHDADPDVAALTDRALQATPTLELLDDDDVRHRLWRVTEPAVITGLADALRRTGAVIADGHHRFAAARAHQRTDPGCTGCDAVLALVTPMGPGGLRVAAIHRVLPDLDLDDAAAAAARGFAVSDVPVPAGSTAEAALTAAVRTWSSRPGGSGYLISDGRRLIHLDDPAPSVQARVPSEAPDAWRRLDVVLAHRGLIEGLWDRPDRPDSVLIAHTVEEALRTATERAGVALLLRPPSPADVAAVARAGARMPRKSTLFLPKPRTGLVLRPLAD